MAIYSKTAPRLLLDISLFDPRQPTGNFFLPNYVRSCQHDYIINPNRSRIPYEDGRPGLDTIWSVACVCQECRSHLDLKIDFTKGTPLDRTCPSPNFPLHHFEFKSDGLQSLDVGHYYHFECSAPQCHAVIDFRIRLPVLTSKEVALLTSHTALKTRLSAAIRNQPERGFPGLDKAQPIESLSNLRTYVDDSLKGQDGRRFSAGNKKFMTTLGDDFRELLLRLGFTFSEPESATDYGYWNLPQPHRIDDEAAADSQRALLEDVKEELTVLMLQRPEVERRPMGDRLRRPPPSTVEFQRMLGTLDYDRSLPRRNQTPVGDNSVPYFNLGAKEDFADRLISFAYDRQAFCAPNNSHIFLGSLQDVANLRNSEALKVKVTMLVSRGQISSKDVDQAYSHLGLDAGNKSVLTDEYILNMYQSRLPDVSPLERAALRRSLRIIGETFPSDLLKDAAAEVIETYQQALSWLGAQEDMDDEFITTMLTSKIADRPLDAALGRKAVEIIAKARNSVGLTEYLRTGARDGPEMDPQSAWRTLEPDSNLHVSEVEPEWLRMIVENRITDFPSRRNEWLRAAEVIARDRDSPELAQFLRNEGMQDISSQSKIDINEPLGLQNIANSCYLNSLLQYLFTIKPLRDLALEYQEYLEGHQPDDLASKKVNEALVKEEEVQKGSLFYDQLRILFEDLVTARTTFKASPEVTRLALGLPLAGTATAKEKSTLPEIVIVEPSDSPGFGPSNHTRVDMDMSDASVDSDSTLQDHSQNALGMDIDSPILILDDAPAVDKPATPPDTSSGPSVLHNGNSPDNTSAIDSNNTPIETPPTPPTDDDETTTKVIPPLPPRPQRNGSAGDTTDEFRRQQDAQEVLANVLPLLRYGLRHEGMDARGEQVDLITRLLFGEEKRTRTRVSSEATKIQYFNGFYCRTPPSPHTVYDLLDSYFDSADFVDEKTGENITEYNAICKMPPMIQLITSQVGYDREKKSAFKMNSRLQLEEKIYFERYTDNADILQRRKQAWALKAELARLESARTSLTCIESSEDPFLDGPEVIQTASAYLKNLAATAEELEIDASLITESTLDTLNKAAEDIRTQVKTIEGEIKTLSERVNGLFRDKEQTPYVLHAVFIHRGNARGGHYWIYIHDAKDNKWRKYNDEYVSIVPESQKQVILNPNPESEGTASLVVYVKEDERDQLIETVCRKPKEEEAQATPTPIYPGALNAIGDWDTGENPNSNGW